MSKEKSISAEITLKRDLGSFSSSLNVYHTWYQDFIFENETGILPTDGYTSIDLSFTWHPTGEDQQLDVRPQAQNITNAERRQHTSFLKDPIPMPGRNFKLSLNYQF